MGLDDQIIDAAEDGVAIATFIVNVDHPAGVFG
jgi:hypothetical protein